jgi:hypothetical protein
LLHRVPTSGATQLTLEPETPPDLEVSKNLAIVPGKPLIVEHAQMTKQSIDNVPVAGKNPFREGKLSWEHLDTSFRVLANSLKAYQMLSVFSKNR